MNNPIYVIADRELYKLRVIFTWCGYPSVITFNWHHISIHLSFSHRIFWEKRSNRSSCIPIASVRLTRRAKSVSHASIVSHYRITKVSWPETTVSCIIKHKWSDAHRDAKYRYYMPFLCVFALPRCKDILFWNFPRFYSYLFFRIFDVIFGYFHTRHKLYASWRDRRKQSHIQHTNLNQYFRNAKVASISRNVDSVLKKHPHFNIQYYNVSTMFFQHFIFYITKWFNIAATLTINIGKSM